MTPDALAALALDVSLLLTPREGLLVGGATAVATDDGQVQYRLPVVLAERMAERRVLSVHAAESDEAELVAAALQALIDVLVP